MAEMRRDADAVHSFMAGFLADVAEGIRSRAHEDLRSAVIGRNEVQPVTLFMETAQCPRCGVFVVAGSEHACSPRPDDVPALPRALHP